MEKLGVADQTITSGAFKDAGSPLRPMRPEERAQIQSVIDDMYARFLAVVREGRPQLAAEQIAQLADGRIYSAHAGARERARRPARRHRGRGRGRARDAPASPTRASSPTTARASTAGTSTRRSCRRSAPHARAGRRPRLRLPQPAFLYLWAPGGLLE